MHYSKPIKPINSIKTEISGSLYKVGYSLIGIIISMIIGYTVFMFTWYGDLDFIGFFMVFNSIGGFIMVAIGAFGLLQIYRISQNLEELGEYYWQYIQSAKKAGEMLKIAMIVSVVTAGVVGIILYIVACSRITGIFKELNSAGLYPKKEDRFLFGSSIAIGIVFFLIIATLSTFWILLFSWYFNVFEGIPIFVSIAGFLLIATIIVHIFALKRFSNNMLLILEKDPSPRQAPPQVVYGPAQPVPQHASYYDPTPTATSIPSEKYKDQAVDGSKEFCPQCGEKVIETNEFCPYCGNYLR